jgi:predicted Zn-dependent peptidase
MLEQSQHLDRIDFPARSFRLDNGLTLIHQHLPATPVVVADIWVKAGTSAEPDEWSGMAHFLEHMIFKGSDNVGVGEFDWIIENAGGMSNAATSHDYAHFYLTTAFARLSNTLPFLADILLRATIPDVEFIRERDVVIEEINSSYDDPDWICFQSLCQNIYRHHPYKRSILGEKEILLQHTPNQMRCFHRTHYQPENMTVVLVGGIEAEAALDLVGEHFSEFSIRSECPPFTPEAEPPAIAIRRQEIQLPNIEQTRLLMGWIGPGVERMEEVVALDLLSVILAGGRCSRLVRELREEQQLVLDICSDFSLQRDSSLFTVAAWLSSSDIREVESIIGERIFQLQTKPISPGELDRAKRLLINNYIFSLETPSQLAGIYGFYHTISTAEQSVLYPQIIARLESWHLQQVASRYLSRDRYGVTVLKPV